MLAEGYFLEQPARPLVKGDLPVDDPGAGEAVVAVEACGLCHTDLSFADGSVPPRHSLPLVLGHEVTGSLLVLGELALLQGDPATAEQRLKWACDTNPKAVGGFFLRGYVAWKRGDRQAATALLGQARDALGPEWTLEGTVSEGDTTKKMHEEESPLARFWHTWDGEPEPATSYAPLDDHLRRFRGSGGLRPTLGPYGSADGGTNRSMTASRARRQTAQNGTSPRLNMTQSIFGR